MPRSIARPPTHPRRGFTIIELAIVVAVISAIVAIAYGSMRPQLPRYRMIQLAKGLESDLGRLRMTAINANRETRLVLEGHDPDIDDPASYGGAWRLQAGERSSMSTTWEDFPPDEPGAEHDQSEGPVDFSPTGSRRTKGVGLAEWEEITGSGTGNANAVVFSPRGWVQNPASDFDAEGYITLRLVNKVALEKGVVDEVHVRIARSGYVRMETTLGTSQESGPVGTGGSSTHGS